MAQRISRRQMLAASAASLGYFHLAPALSAAKVAGANGKLTVAGIGVGGKGDGDIDQAGSLMEVIALCDVDDGPLGKKQKKWPTAKAFKDYRKIFDDSSLLKNIDAFTVSTPDHNHTLPSILAMRAGKHVYCQKPLTHDVYEAHLMRAEAKKNKVCTQMGNQGTAANGLRRAVELVRAGVLGDVTEIHVWTNRPIWPQAPGVMTRPPESETPQSLNFDAFLGPAPERPYAKGYHPFAWRGWWDYGTGAIGDMACHTGNMAFMALKLGHPTKVSAEAGDVNPETCPSYAHVTLEFPSREKLAPVTLNWYEGKKDGKKLVPPEGLIEKAIALDANEKRKVKLVESGSILVGSKGIAYSPDDYGSEVFFSTGDATSGRTKPELLLINNGGDSGQKKEWVEAIKANKPELALSNFDYAGLLTAAFLLGNVAVRAGEPFTWDGEKCMATDCKGAAKFIRREYRKGWDLIGYNV
ncbi:MAG TPA: Gfo/Idh/MocA family oxidoreductase [Gemmata sp.]|jgi:predicted dehydrogenase|nr:Gfo/Idh/MocA family oxidoreductase [Gemmata sp.]